MPKFSTIISKLFKDIKTDFATVSSYANKYSNKSVSNPKIYKLFITNIGFQSAVAIRCMHFARDISLPFGGEILSRLIRHFYGMEVHWKAKIDPGVSFVHGNGIVISKYAVIHSGCILMQNVTLGASKGLDTTEFGAPTLERNVHVGPGAILLGPITIGEGSKIMAGSVVVTSIPPNSIVRSPMPSISKRNSSFIVDNDDRC